MASTRRLAAILAADVADYSRLMGADEEGSHERLKAHLSELVDPKIEEHRGRVGEVAGLRRPDVLEPIEVADDLRGNRGGALAQVRVGAVRAPGAHREFEPQRPLLAKAQRPRAARLV